MKDNMVFVYIFYNDNIIIEVQENRPRLSPFIRTKSRLANLKEKLVNEYDKTILTFLKLLGQDFPPFLINKNFFCRELISLIEKSMFCFKKDEKHASLKKYPSLSILKQTLPFIKCIIEPQYIEIRINNIYKHGVKASIYIKSFESSKLIPINYDFLVPTKENLSLCYVNNEKKKMLLKELNKYFSQLNGYVLFIPYDVLNEIKLNDKIHIKYFDNKKKKSKPVSFALDSIFKVNLFSKDRIKKSDVQLYNCLLNNYLEGKKYIEWNETIILFGNDDLISQFDEKILNYSFGQKHINASYTFLFKKLWEMKPQIKKDDILRLLNNSSFSGRLKKYQIEGVYWLLNLYYNKIDGGLLADEMGLGKTIQLIAFLSIVEPDRVLIITPATIINNWKEEINKFNLKYYKTISFKPRNSKKITILSYETARNKINELNKYKFDIMVLDESQKIKNIKTKLFSSINKIPRDFTVIMTGTPIENGLSDVWSMFAIINPGLQKIFNSKIKPIIHDKKSYKKAVTFTGKLLYPLIIQRRKKDVLSLPERNYNKVIIEFSSKERAVYERLIKIFNSAISTGLSGRIQYIALEALLRLRQFCSLHNMLPDSLLNSPNLKESKIDAIIQLTQTIVSQGEKVVIFSQFLPTLNWLQHEFLSKNFTIVRLDGSTSKKERTKAINEFQNNDACNIFLISLKAGGTGINLTKATNSILVEPWWNPAVEEQAFARIHRIGQSKKVNIYRFFYSNTIETDIDELINHKVDIFKTMSNTISSIHSNSIQFDLAKKIFDAF